MTSNNHDDFDTGSSRSRSRPAHERSSTDGLIRRSWHAMADMLHPFSSSALASLPKTQRDNTGPDREIRADNVPDDAEDVVHRDYNAINTVRVPKKIATPIKVEGKVWFANERSAYYLLLLLSYTEPSEYDSMVVLCQYVHLTRNPVAGSLQRLRRSCSEKFCLRVCCYQHWCLGVHAY